MTLDNTPALAKVSVIAEEILPGDRTSSNGKTRFVRTTRLPSGTILWRIQTRGARSATTRSFAPGEDVTVWRKPGHTTEDQA